MWIVDQIESREREFDFGSSGLDRHSTAGLFADGVEIVNALDLVDFSADADGAIQLIVCDYCGTPGCNAGNRVSFRRLDDGLLMIPSFASMARGDWEMTEYGPPHFIAKRGAPLFSDGALHAVLARLPALVGPSSWPPLNSREAALLLQWEAPYRVLGEFPDPPRLHKNMILAAAHGSELEILDTFRKLLDDALAAEQPVSTTRGEPVTFYLDLDHAGYPEWEPVALVGGQYRLALAPGVGLSFGDDSR